MIETAGEQNTDRQNRKYGNETGDSVNLTSCDYLLDSTKRFFWEDDEIEEVTLSIYAEDEQINKIL